ncbi:MAG TPA: DUF3800 domain-containing protein [Candidatus Saccharimonadales bacterium]|nr:DUF3800 domain-containing protein [Candidatus Saccharimonadales bacterium]
MLTFLDESGDTGRKTDKGSSAYFLVSLIIFLDNDEALACDQRIELLRTELNLPANYEFHFSRNSKRVKEAFLEAVNRYNFSIVTVAINKDPKKLYGEGFKVKSSFYKYACQMVLTNALPYLDHATLVIDKSGSTTFQSELKKYIKSHTNLKEDKITKVKTEESHKNNLLQLTDYCVSIGNRKLQKKSDAKSYYKFISTKELSWHEWPK